MCRANIKETMAEIDQYGNIDEEIVVKIGSLITPKNDTMDELSRLYELDFCSRRNSYKLDELEFDKIIEKVPRKIQTKSNKPNNFKDRWFTAGPVEYGLPVPVCLRRSYNTSIVGNHLHVLNVNLIGLYKERPANAH